MCEAVQVTVKLQHKHKTSGEGKCEGDNYSSNIVNFPAIFLIDFVYGKLTG